MLVSLFRSARDNVPEQREADWPSLLGIVGTHRVLPAAEKTDAPALCPAEWPEGARRSKAGVLRVWFGALDYDKLTQAQLSTVLEAVAPLACLLYTTWSHAERHARDGTWSFRLLVPFSRPVEAGEWAAFWPRMNAALGSLADPRCRDPSRIYFLPSAPAAAGAWIERQEGPALDVDDVLASPAPGSEGSPTPYTAIEVGRDDLDGLAARLSRRRSSHMRRQAERLRRVLDGEPFAETGARDTAAFELACVIAEEWPGADAEALAGFFAPSLEAMESQAPEAPTVAQVAEKIARKQDEVLSRLAHEEEERRAAHSMRILDAFNGARQEPYSEDELDAFAASAGTTREGFKRRWIIQAGTTFYLFQAGGYKTPVSAADLVPAAERDLAAATTAGVSVWKVNDKGELRPKTPMDLVLQYGTIARSVRASLSARRSWYDAGTQSIVEAPCPLRDLEPARSEEGLAWLRALGGDQADLLLDWVAKVTELDEPIAAVYFDGVGVAGKTLFAEALARLWTTGGPTPLDQAMGDFNESLSTCPLVIADEVLPEKFRRVGSTGELRAFIQARTRPLKRKYRAAAQMEGAVRLVLAANNRHMLDTAEGLTLQDISAITDRVLYVPVGEEPERMLRALGHDRVRRFVQGDEIARLALWLRDTRTVSRGARFLVGGRDSQLHRALTTSTGIRSAVCHWLVSYLQQPAKMDHDGKRLVRVSKGALLVTARAMVQHWDMYATNVKPPPSSAISGALAGLSKGKRQLTSGEGKATNYWVIRTENLLAWCSDQGYATDEEIFDALSVDTPEPLPTRTIVGAA